MGMRVIHPTDCPSQIAAPLHPNLIWAVLDGGRSLATRLALTDGDVDAPATSRGQGGRATSHTLSTDRAVSGLVKHINLKLELAEATRPSQRQPNQQAPVRSNRDTYFCASYGLRPRARPRVTANLCIAR